MSYFRLFKELKVFDLIKNGFARVALAKAGRKSKKSINFKKSTMGLAVPSGLTHNNLDFFTNRCIWPKPQVADFNFIIKIYLYLGVYKVLSWISTSGFSKRLV